MKNMILSIVSFTIFVGCGSANQPTNDRKTFETTLPCADCSEIKSILQLDSNGSFILSDTYVKDINQTFTQSGLYKTDGEIIIITSDDNETFYFKKDGLNLNRLDADKNLIEGEFKDYYTYKLQK